MFTKISYNIIRFIFSFSCRLAEFFAPCLGKYFSLPREYFFLVIPSQRSFGAG